MTNAKAECVRPHHLQMPRSPDAHRVTPQPYSVNEVAQNKLVIASLTNLIASDQPITTTLRMCTAIFPSSAFELGELDEIDRMQPQAFILKICNQTPALCCKIRSLIGKEANGNAVNASSENIAVEPLPPVCADNDCRSLICSDRTIKIGAHGASDLQQTSPSHAPGPSKVTA